MSAILATEEAGILRLAWDNRTVRKERLAFCFLLAFWVIWAPATVVATVAAFSGGGTACFFAFWSVFGWLGTLLIPYTLLGRWWSEWVEVSAESVTIGAVGLLSPRTRTYPVGVIREIALGWYHDGYEHESMTTLGVVRVSALGFRQRALFGYWLAPTLKRHVFEVIRAFAESQAIPLRFAVYGAEPRAAPDAGRE